MRILLLEDNARVAEVVGAGLRKAGHSVTPFGRCAEALPALSGSHFDVAIVDIGLPDGSGLDVCRSAREQGLDLPILVLTARNQVGDRVGGLDAGADDYLGKPFSMAELVARVRALGRRGPRWTESRRSYSSPGGIVRIDRDARALEVEGSAVPLTAREFDIVALLAWRDGRVVSRDDIVESVWGVSGDGSERGGRAAPSLDVLMTRIRRKLGERGVADAVRTVRQVGYAWALVRSKRS